MKKDLKEQKGWLLSKSLQQESLVASHEQGKRDLFHHETVKKRKC